jgi:hypothetical protein
LHWCKYLTTSVQFQNKVKKVMQKSSFAGRKELKYLDSIGKERMN